MSNENINTYRVTVLYEAKSPITHMKGVSGNEALINREAIFTERGKTYVPVLSGNALRHKTIREPGARHLIREYELNGKLTIDQVNFMLVGGTLSESSVTSNLKIISEMKECFPLFRLLGGSLRNQILAGSLQSGRGVLVCEENRKVLKGLLPKEFELPMRLKSFEDFIDKYQYTRGDIKNNKGINNYLSEKDQSESRDSTLMIYSGQTIMSGSLFYQDIVIPNVSKYELGAYLSSIKIWIESGGIIGGKSSIGHGKLKPSIYIESTNGKIEDFDNYINLYNDYILSVKDRAINWLNENLGDKPKVEKEEKPKKEKVLKEKKPKEEIEEEASLL